MSNRNTCPPRRFKDFPQFDFETTISTFPTPGCERLPRRRVARGHVKTATMRRDSDGCQRVVRLNGWSFAFVTRCKRSYGTSQSPLALPQIRRQVLTSYKRQLGMSPLVDRSAGDFEIASDLKRQPDTASASSG